jgi:YbbR domain-containing protein
MRRDKTTRRLFYNWQIKILCFLFAGFLFFYFGLATQESRTVTLPLTVIMPEGYKADSIVPETVELQIKGKENQVFMINVSNVKISVDFSKVSEEGVAIAPVVIDVGGEASVLDLSTISLSTNPSQVKIYFSADV